ncbi:MAG: hypothetical protein ACNYWM_02615 [Methanosarcinales archaeon]
MNREKESLNILRKLKEKSEYVKWNKDKRIEYFGLIIKKTGNMRELSEMGFKIFDMDDLLKSPN